MERLVGFGIDLNLQDSNGDTALHIALSRETADVLSSETPQLKKVWHTYESIAQSLFLSASSLTYNRKGFGARPHN